VRISFEEFRTYYPTFREDFVLEFYERRGRTTKGRCIECDELICNNQLCMAAHF